MGRVQFCHPYIYIYIYINIYIYIERERERERDRGGEGGLNVNKLFGLKGEGGREEEKGEGSPPILKPLVSSNFKIDK